jgi:hypothetical protein
MTTNKEAIAKAPERRVRRTTIGARRPLYVEGKEAGYHYRFVNDTGDRIQTFLDAGWEQVPAKNVRVGDKRINQVSLEGSTATASVGGGLKGHLLRIKNEWYEEDQAAKQAEVARIEDATRQEALNGTYGKLDLSRD